MNAHGLMINNLVLTCKPEFKGVKDYVETFITSEYIDYIDKGKLLVKPIKITKKRLLELGAKKIPKNNYHVTLYSFKALDNSQWCVGYREDAWHLFEGENDAFCNVRSYSPLKYIHKLQNLYFALTNEELSTKKQIKITINN